MQSEPDSTPSEASSSKELIAPPTQVTDALLVGDTEAALSALDGMETEAPEHMDAWTMYRAEALLSGGDEKGAMSALDRFEERFPNSPWLAKARFQRAEAARALGEHAAAEQILREEATALRGEERRSLLGQELVAAAEALEARAMKAPTDPRRNELRASARLLLGHAYQLQGADGFRLDVAQRLAHLSLARLDRAEAAQWAKALGEGAQDKGGESSVLGLEANLVAARLSVGHGGARLHLDVERALDAALEGEANASPTLQELRGFTLSFLGDAWSLEGRPLFAIDAWERLLEEQPTHTEAGRAAAQIARILTNLGRNEDALAAWARVRELPAAAPGSDRLALVHALLGFLEKTAAEPQPDLDALRRRALFERASLQEAMGRYEDATLSYGSYVTEHPGAEDWTAAQEAILSCTFGRAITWLELSEDASREDLAAAENALREFAAEYPLDRRASEALYRWATLPAFYGETYLKRDAKDERLALYSSSVERLKEIARTGATGDDELSSRALFQAAEITQNHLEDPQAAIQLYTRVSGSNAADATFRLREMQDTVLRVKTLGLTRPGEPVSIEVETRNIDEITVQAVRLDLGQYFLRHGTTAGIERLDLDLIAPDFEQLMSVEDYEPYAGLVRTVNVPLGDADSAPGVYAITVVADGKRATTLAIRSHLDLIVKRAASQVFVLAAEVTPDGTHRVAEGVDVTVSYTFQGKRETATLRTDQGGTASVMAPEGTAFGTDTHVFASRDGHVAATHLEGAAPGNALVLVPRSHVQLDRSAYRAGEELSFRAVLRGVKDGEWQMPALSRSGRASEGLFTAELVGPSGVVLGRSETAEISEYGTFGGSFQLDSAAPSGQWSVVVRSPGGARAQAAFIVGEIEVPRVALDLKALHSVIMRGEEVEVEAQATTAWGAPLSDALLVWHDPDGTEIRSRTDGAGRATLVYNTEAAIEGQQLAFRAHLPEEGGISAQTSVRVAEAALVLSIRPERDVVLAGESFLAAITAAAPDGKTLPTEVTVTATRTFSPRPGRFAEERVFDSSVTTNTSGEAAVSLTSESGGTLVIRASARDRFGREVTAECVATVSGTNDAEPLRVLCDDATIHAGEDGTVRVVDRSASGGLALMTVQSSKVLEHRVLTLAPGVTQLSFAAGTQHVPDVQVSISAIRGTSFYERSATFQVTRPLEISVEASPSVRPGGTAELILRTSNGLGEPVAAELSLALVNRALLRAFPPLTDDFQSRFEIHGRRTPAFITGASATFHYDGKTEEIDAAILAEGRRNQAREDVDAMLEGVAGALDDSFLEEAEMGSELDMAPSSFGKRAAPKAMAAPAQARGRMPSPGAQRGSGLAAAPEVGFDNPTAYWNGSVVTDANGMAKVSVPMPMLEARWQLDVTGVSKDHRFGSQTASIVTDAPIIAVLGAPSYLSEGDEPELRGEVILKAPRSVDVPVEFELRVAGLRSLDARPKGAGAEPRQSIQRGTAVLPAGSARLSYTFDRLSPVAADGGLELELVCRLKEGDEASATDTRGCIVRPQGYLVVDTAAGRTRSEERIELRLEGADIVELTLVAGATEAQWLVDAALGDVWLANRLRPGSHSRRSRAPIDRGLSQGALAMASRALGVATLLEQASQSGGFLPEVIAELRERGDSLVAALASRVQEGGGWGLGSGCWRSPSGASDNRTTALATVALCAMERAGCGVPAAVLENAVNACDTMLASAESDEDRALLCWALESAGRGNDLVLHRLHRERARLSADAAAPLALALAAANKRPMAAEVASLLDLSFDALTHRSSKLERTALATWARAAAGVGTESDQTALQGQRPWVQPVGCGLAVAASAAAGALQSSSLDPVTFEVTVEGGSSETVQLRPKEAFGGTRELALSLPAGEASSATVSLRLISGPAFDYALLAEGFSDEPPPSPQGFPITIGAADLRGPLPRWRGRPLKEGFQAVEARASATWEDDVEGLGFGGEGRISLDIRVPKASAQLERPDLWLELPLPAGVTATVAQAGGYGTTATEVVDGALLASIPKGQDSARIVLDVVGTRPGVWTMRAPALRSALDPAITIYGESRRMTVYAPGAAPASTPKPTPDERLSRGSMAFEDEDMAAAIEALRPLYQDWKRELRPDALAETARLLLFATLKEESEGRGNVDDAAIVDWFEVLKERYPSLFISFDGTLRIAAAYASIGEPLRANLLFRAVIDETLGEDLRVAAAMDEAGEWMRASQMAASIWRRYPDSPSADDADLALANRLIERGLDTSGAHGLGPKERSALTLRGLSRLRRKVALGSGRGTVAADAGLALVSTYARLEQWSRAAERAELFGRVIDDPIFRDSFRYSEAVARWSDRDGEDPAAQEARAVEILQEIATQPLEAKDGRGQWSPNRDLALYILAQVYHARKDTEKAVEHYARIEHAFADARAALGELRSERLTLEEEVVRARPSETLQVQFEHKGIDRVDVLVYPVDLMTLAIRERDLSRVTAVDLAGVTPTLAEAVDLERSVLRPSEGSIDISLPAPGAYLAMLRGGEVHCSALLLATDLDLDVVLAGNGSVRAQAMFASTDTFAMGASVRIIGESIESLETDRRGVAAADGMEGRVTVIARSTRPGAAGGAKEQHYAFYSSAEPAGSNEAPEPNTAAAHGLQGDMNYLSNVLQQNDSNYALRQQRVEEDVRRTRQGVQVQQAQSK